ncbi:AMP-binding protein [Actinomadura macrotermitis]|uniref:p-hydroxybenzoic acid--AMP ligase FadD22 n=1 Tax=Actinomadura macrotermitis TaxID=2585200 RepID=A0A7K0BZ20_9ACTN|nr:AMP-binding protein [Actinomadura macrotermitis]MQY06421.1 p-hydroxybenzoic acid--AMP ligase FadD22 [Actinomadura macrotermitis]
MEGNLAIALAHRADTQGWRDRPLFHTGGAVLTHGEAHDAAARASGVLHAAGVRPGQRVLIALPDSPGFVAALLGTLRLGAVAVLAGPEQSAAEHAYVRADAEPQAVVCDAALAHRFPTVQVLTGDDLSDEPAAVPAPAPAGPDTPAYVQYTSGTTGKPKGVVHRHGDPAAYVRALALGALGMTAGDVTFSLSKACYPFGLGATVFFPMFCGGSSVLWPQQPSVAGAAAQLQRHRPTLLFTVPTWYARLVGDPAVRAAAGSLRAAVSAGEPLLPSLADRIERVLGCPVLDGLGSTEAGHTFVSNTLARRRRGTLGVVLDPFQIEVRGEGGAPAPAGETGVLYVRGPSVMREYLGRPDRTAEVPAPDGWLRTGDLVHVDAEGFVHHHGRLLDQVTVSGEPVRPLEVERIFGLHPEVVEVAVVADPAGRLRAFTVLEGRPPAPAVAGPALLAFARERLPDHKVPRSVTFLPELPRTSTGKVRRGLLARLGDGEPDMPR